MIMLGLAHLRSAWLRAHKGLTVRPAFLPHELQLFMTQVEYNNE